MPPPTRGRPVKWTKMACIDDAKKYETRGEWAKAKGGYHSAREKGWLDECCRHMKRLKRGPKKSS